VVEDVDTGARVDPEAAAGEPRRAYRAGAGSGCWHGHQLRVLPLDGKRRLAVIARQAAERAEVPITLTTDTVEEFDAGEPFDAVVCSLVLCSVGDPDDVLQQLFSTLRPGGELRYLEHVASTGMRAGVQRLADATVWPRLLGNCHTYRDTEQSIVDAGFEVRDARREWVLPAWLPVPVAETAIGRAVRPG
jgi:SAM-dependent methyltransferase